MNGLLHDYSIHARAETECPLECQGSSKSKNNVDLMNEDKIHGGIEVLIRQIEVSPIRQIQA